MGVEIEHKYLVVSDCYRELATGRTEIRQGYITRDPARTVRIRVAGTDGFLTIKGKTGNSSRPEFEYMIPFEDALELLKLCEGKIIHKIRHIVEYEGFTWEIDEFMDRTDSLVVAEIELADENTVYPIPPFVGENVTGMSQYYNSNL